MDAAARPRIMYLLVTLLVTFDLLTSVHTQQVAQLRQHTLPDGLQSVNGSDPNGGCSRVGQGHICVGTSYLTDCVIPFPGGFQSSWAAGLFTVNRSGQSFHIGFDFNGPVNFTRVELDLFNCPEWCIAARKITVYEYNFGIFNFDIAVARASNLALGRTTTTTTTSCTSIVRVAIPLELPRNPNTSYVIDFPFDSTTTNCNIQWIHIAEVRFLEEEGAQCPTPSSTAVIPTQTSQQHGPTTTSTHETIRHILLQETTRPTLLQEAVQTGLLQETLRLTLSQETVRPTLSQGTVPPTLPRETVQRIPGTVPLPDNPIIAAVIIIVVVVLLVITIGVVILAAILIRAWRKKQQLEVEKFQSIMMGNESIELKLRQEEYFQLDNPNYADQRAYKKLTGQGTNRLEANREEETIPENLGTLEDSQPNFVPGNFRETNAPKTQNRNIPELKEGIQAEYSEGLDTIQPLYSAVQKNRPQLPQKSSELYADLKAEKESNTDLPVYSAVVKEPPPTVPSKSEELTEYLESQNQPNTLGGEYKQVSTKTVPINSRYALPAKPPRLVALSDPIFEGMESNPVYWSIDHPHDPTNVPQENISDIYTLPNTAGSQTVEKDHGMLEVVYSEPIKPSVFTDAVESPNSSKLVEDLQPYAPIYTVPVAPPQSEEMPLEVLPSNIRKIRELGTGIFGEVVLAKTVGLSPKDLKLSESDDDKSKSTFVAVKKLKPNAPKTTKEAFEKEVKFMSRLDNSNVICMLGVCYGDTPFIMMEYMEKGDLNQYLKKFNVVTSTDSGLQSEDLITSGMLVHMTTQIASGMKYLASRSYVHRDLATRNCLVGPNYLVKIADFGMSRSLYESHYYIIHGRAVLPIRWMSTECFYGKFSQKSDVWAFGVTMWEVFTLVKEQPYTDISDQDVIKDAIRGKSRKLLAKPAACPLEVYEIMLKCWAHNPSQRATFEELFRMLSAICSSY